VPGFRLEILLDYLVLVRGAAQDVHKNLWVGSGRRLCAMPILSNSENGVESSDFNGRSSKFMSSIGSDFQVGNRRCFYFMSTFLARLCVYEAPWVRRNQWYELRQQGSHQICQRLADVKTIC